MWILGLKGLKRRLNVNRSFLLNTSFICVRIKKKNSLLGCALSQLRFETEASGNSEMT